MTTTTKTDQFFGKAMQNLRQQAKQRNSTSMTDYAVQVAIKHATDAYISGKSMSSLHHSAGDPNLRAVSAMDAIRHQLEELFGDRSVSVHRDDDYALGIVIIINFS